MNEPLPRESDDENVDDVSIARTEASREGGTPAAVQRTGTQLTGGTPEAEAPPARNPPAEDVPDRIQLLWRAKYWIVALSIVIAAITYGVCQLVPKTYSASAVVMVSLPPAATAGAADPTTAAGDYASVYAQEATLGPVISAASKLSGTSPSTLSNSVSAGTINGESLVSVRSNASQPTESTRRANAVATALVSVISAQNAASVSGYSQSVRRGLAPITKQINALTAKLLRPNLTVSKQTIIEGQLSTLDAERGDLEGQAASGSASTASLSLFARAGTGQQTAPKVTLYTIVAFAIALLVVAQIAVLVGERRGRRSSRL